MTQGRASHTNKRLHAKAEGTPRRRACSWIEDPISPAPALQVKPNLLHKTRQRSKVSSAIDIVSTTYYNNSILFSVPGYILPVLSVRMQILLAVCIVYNSRAVLVFSLNFERPFAGFVGGNHTPHAVMPPRTTARYTQSAICAIVASPSALCPSRHEFLTTHSHTQWSKRKEKKRYASCGAASGCVVFASP